MLILGVDPGTAVTGYGLIRLRDRGTMQLVECGVIRTRPRDPLADRLLEIAASVRELIARWHPDAIAVEDIFYARNVRTTVTLGHARGVILLAGAECGLTIHEFPPAEVKKSVAGSGAATKDQVQFMVTKILRLAAPPSPVDASDAVAVAMTLAMRAHLPKMARATVAAC